MNLLIDAHLDLAFNALSLGRDLNLTIAQGRQRTLEHDPAWRNEIGTLTTTLPEIQANGPAVVCGTIFILPDHAATNFDTIRYSTPQEAAKQAHEQLAWYQAQEAAGNLRFIRSRTDLDAAVTTDGPLGLILLMEGADGLLTPADLPAWHAAGLRWIGPAWQQTRYSGGTKCPGPLTELGRELLTTMNELGVALDTSHLAEESFWQALELARVPVAASHSNCRALLEASEFPDRFLSDAMIRAIIEHDGVIGIALFNAMLDAKWDDTKASVTLEAVVRQIEHVCNLAGNTRHVAIGSDLDGGFGVEQIPAEFDTWADLRLIGTALSDAGWQPDDINNVLGANWHRWFQQVFR